MRTIICLFSAFAGLATGAEAVSQGRVTGKVFDSSGRPVPNATVTLTSLSKLSSMPSGRSFVSEPARSYGGRSDKDGAFAISGIPAGEYNACADSTADHMLSSCLFQFPRKLQVGAGVAASINLTLPAATTIEIRVADPQRIVDEKGEAPSAEGLLQVGRNYQIGALIYGIHFRRAIFERPRGDKLIYRVVVPEGAAAQLVTSGEVRFTTGGNQALESGNPSLPLPTAKGPAGARPVVELSAQRVSQ